MVLTSVHSVKSFRTCGRKSIEMLSRLTIHRQFGSSIRPRERHSSRILSRGKTCTAISDRDANTDSLHATVKSIFAEAVSSAVPVDTEVDISVTECSSRSNGDYQCNNAMQIFAGLKRKGDKRFSSPRSVAEAILHALPVEKSFFSSTTVAGPGFINVTLSREFLAERVTQILSESDADGAFSRKKHSHSGLRVVVDYSSPNIAKEMHVGHLRSTIIGESICRALELVGTETIRLNHVGDWGTQFGMLLTHMEEQSGSKKYAIKDLQEFYKESKQRFDADDDFKARALSAVVSLQSGDEDLTRKWLKICDLSRKEFDEIYELLDVKILERGESFYNKLIPTVLEDLVSKQIAVPSDGALCIFSEEDGPPLICRKRDGGFNYASTDLAALWQQMQRINDLQADRIIYVTDVGQSKHFDAIFDAANRAGWLDSSERGARVCLDHVGFGLVMGEDGKRFRTRSGDTVPLKSLLQEAQSRCLQSLQERGSKLAADELQEASKIMGIAAVKYADLQNNRFIFKRVQKKSIHLLKRFIVRLTNYTFSYDRMLDLKGNTAVYLLYTYARIASLLSRGAENVSLNTIVSELALLIVQNILQEISARELKALVLIEDEERFLALTILKFPDVVEAVVQELLPSRLCDYTYNLCIAFNEFYGSCKVIGSPEETSRLVLCQATAISLRQSFNILGIMPLDRL